MQRMLRVSWLFLLFGLAVWSFSVYVYTSAWVLIAHGEHARGTVTAFSRNHTTYFPVVAFKTSDGTRVEFVGSSGSSSPTFVRGQQVDVIYTPGNPPKARINTFGELWAPPLLLTTFGAIFFAIGFAPIFIRWKRGHTAADLRVHGTPLLAQYERVAVNTGTSVNGASPYRIFVQWQDPATSQVHMFHSDDIWYDPAKFIDRKQLTVYVDPRDLKRYSVDISFLPPAAT